MPATTQPAVAPLVSLLTVLGTAALTNRVTAKLGNPHERGTVE